ncbi:Zn-dependent hydrolase [Pantoea dispersa]|uniref:Zn-dependent hydrolase n=1 Tax=Pantoea dispersa TaxID=59814 RepID=UPI001CA6D58D|nr:Zn-dependent hydrolase [Pantoea dispersa]QZY97586.1 Zn-dependent hydrolase [Pantoea dispersa]
MTSSVRIDGARLWQMLQTFSTFGATPGGGVTRLALSEEDRQGRDTLQGWARQAGFDCEVDELGNMFMRRRGRHPELPAVLIGSHADSQPLGGNYDGIYGVLAGLEVLYTFNDAHIETERDILLVNWTNEEGARFAPAMLASGVWAGVFSRDYALGRRDRDGVSLGEALDRIGYAGERQACAQPLHACYELHIEQGPILEAEGIAAGVVHAALGQRWFDVIIQGFAAHAGTTPMDLRRDALCGFAELALAVEKIGKQYGDDGRATVGMAQITPGSRNVVPGAVLCSVEFRHPELPALDEMEAQLMLALEDVRQRKLEPSVEKILDYPPVNFDPGCIARIEKATRSLGYSQRRMVSGAGHDACYINRVAPTAMIFIPCVKGISHNEEESISPRWAQEGANVLLATLLLAANET